MPVVDCLFSSSHLYLLRLVSSPAAYYLCEIGLEESATIATQLYQ